VRPAVSAGRGRRFRLEWDARSRAEVYGSLMETRRVLAAVRSKADWLLAGALAVLGLCELFLRSLNADFHGPRALNALFVVLIALPVAWRRRAPVAALVAFWVPVQVWLDVLYGAHSNLPVEPFLALLILVYSAAAFADPTGQRVVVAVLAALYASELMLLAVGLKGWGNVVPGLIFITLAYVLGRGVRSRRLHSASLEQRTEELKAEREVLARLAVVEERDRIARELHDVIAHSVSVTVVQAGAAERLLDSDPEGARRALAAIREAGSEALDELRRLLGLLHDTTVAGLAAEPQPGLQRLETLLQQARDSGVAVEYAVEGTPRPLPPGIDLAAYRIVQEALTNVRKHARHATALVHVGYGPRELDLRVSNDGTGGTELPLPGAGHGLVGMRERVALYGGTLAYGACPSGGFEVRARIPLHGAAA
jgi:signal transduction histidine kinase